MARWAHLLGTLLSSQVRHAPAAAQTMRAGPTLLHRGGALVVRAEPGVQKVFLVLSQDCGYTYERIPLARGADGLYALGPRPLAADAIVFAQAQGADGAVLSSVPTWPATCPVRVREFGPRP
jgi:hypothetical protein